MNNPKISKIRKQVIKSIFDFNYKKESNICKYLKIILTDNTNYNCTDVELNTNNILIDSNNKLITINYEDIKQVILF